MSREISNTPALFKGVMVSSTFTDLQEHRAILIDALRKQQLLPIDMESSILIFWAEFAALIVFSGYWFLKTYEIYHSNLSRPLALKTSA